jgi:hypothetical protein
MEKKSETTCFGHTSCFSKGIGSKMEKNEETLYFRPHLRGILHTTGQQHLLIVLALLHTFGGKTSYLSRGSEVCFLQSPFSFS